MPAAKGSSAAGTGTVRDRCSQASDYESGGQEFESLRARQKPNKYRNNLHVRNDAMQKEIICMASAWLRPHDLHALEHPFVRQLLDEDRRLEASARALLVSHGEGSKGILSVWHVTVQDLAQRFMQRVIPIGIDDQGKRNTIIELMVTSLDHLSPESAPLLTAVSRAELVSKVIPEMLRRDLAHKGLLSDSVTLAWRLLAWVELN
jgi:hypothetical protein